MRRVMGIETEYGVVAPGRPEANPMLLSSHVVGVQVALQEQVREAGTVRARWDYDDEDPLHDARGFHLERASALPSQLTDDPSHPAGSADDSLQALPRLPEEYDDPGTANVILTNGARLYVDHAHPEYSSPEVTNPYDLVVWDRAGELVVLECVRALAANPGLPDVTLYKNNVDGKGATYGTHENYLVNRDVPFAGIVAWLTPFLVTRQVFCGAGRVGLGQRGEEAGFQLSQRADYVEAEVGLETTLRRPIINTRDEPHADATLWRRLHVIVGDATMLEPVTYLRAGTTSLVLWLVEQAVARGDELEPPPVVLRDPVGAFHQVSRDTTVSASLELADGRRSTAIEVQRWYLDQVLAACGAHDEATADILARWADVLARLADDPATCARDVEWVAKLRLLEGLRRREHLGWDHAKLAAVDLQWSDLRPERGLYHRVLAAGAVDTIVTDEQVRRAAAHPPADTRAYFRGEAMARYCGQVSAASWDSVIFDVPGRDTLQRVPMRDPLRGTLAHVGALLDACPDAGSLLDALVGDETGD
ncbi:MAG: proteasome accessory factor PafA2 [Micrococcales bacterium]|nr:proteasome accessory factor PafA2 [Micrococcales bacterium]MCL2668195.1 proteasome accessory factor PafA2 [Micrococcales bacterium]